MYICTHIYIYDFVKYGSLISSHRSGMYTALPKFHLNVKTNDFIHTPRIYENDCYSYNELCIKNSVKAKKKRERIVTVR